VVIRVLTFEGCPHCEAAKDLVEKTVRDLHLQADIETIQVKNENEAQTYQFLGSPSIQIDGQDIERTRRNEKSSYSCRVYRTPTGITGVPPRELLVNAIRDALPTSP
jgi:glutaredoxin